MNRNARTISYAASQPDLRARLPAAFRHTGTTRRAFDQVRDPLLAEQLRDLNKTEAQRRGEQDQGSLMIKRQRPQPELKPRYHHAITRVQFDLEWLREQRAAMLAYYRQQAGEHGATNTTPQQPGLMR